jgi:hypothetical protein
MQRRFNWDLNMLSELIVTICNRVYVYYYACPYVWFVWRSIWHDNFRTRVLIGNEVDWILGYVWPISCL